MIYIGIDPGVNNGFAVYDTKKKLWLYTGELFIWEVFEKFDALIGCDEDRMDIKVFIEDPRQISGAGFKALGAGWVRVLAGQYENYCLQRGLKYQLIRPNADYVKKSVEFIKINTGILTEEKHDNERDAISILFFYGI